MPGHVQREFPQSLGKPCFGKAEHHRPIPADLVVLRPKFEIAVIGQHGIAIISGALGGPGKRKLNVCPPGQALSGLRKQEHRLRIILPDGVQKTEFEKGAGVSRPELEGGFENAFCTVMVSGPCRGAAEVEQHIEFAGVLLEYSLEGAFSTIVETGARAGDSQREQDAGVAAGLPLDVSK